MMTLSQARDMLPGSILVGDGNTQVQRVHSDTRTLRAGDLFVALKGERFDGHDYLASALRAGAVAALAERGLTAAGLPGVQVADTQQALLQLARAWRRRFELPLIAVTGSNGKTTVTQMIASILKAWVGPSAFATVGNLNNHIGVPLTLLRLRQDTVQWHRAGVVELGMNHPGEIAVLADLCAPSVALVNNAQREHLEFMDSVAAVAAENGAVIQALAADGVAVYPADDPQSGVWRSLAAGRPTWTFALEGLADVTCAARWHQDHWAVDVSTPRGSLSLVLRVAGWHNVKNALAATACALAAGCPLQAVQQGLQSFRPVSGRSDVQRLDWGGRGVTLIDDTYNANPDSVRAAIDVLAQLPGRRWLILGDMGEVGNQGAQFHAEVGAHAHASGLQSLWAAGTASGAAAQAFPGARHFDSVPALIAALAQAPECDAVLVKGSRFMKMERVVAALRAGGATDAA